MLKGSQWVKLQLMIPELKENIRALVSNEMSEDFVDLSIRKFVVKNSKNHYPQFRLTPSI